MQQLQQQLTSRDVCARLGNISLMTLWRLGNDRAVNFPAPAKVRNRNYWSETALSTWLASQGGAV